MNVTTPQVSDCGTDCKAVSEVLARIGEKWSVIIVIKLAIRAHRFSELKRIINGISQRMLTLCLRGLERDGIVKRTVYPVIPPHVEYELTPLGRSLTEPVNALGMWALQHKNDIRIARTEYDLLQESEKNIIL